MQRKYLLRAAGIGAPALLGFGIFSISGAAMWLFMMYYFLQWWGILGLLAGLLLPPLATLFPFIYWWQESFPVAYLSIWLIGLLALAVGVMLSGGMAMHAGKRYANKVSEMKPLSRKIIDGEVVDQE